MTVFSKRLHNTARVSHWRSSMNSVSFIRLTKVNMSLIAWYKSMYYISIVLSDISVWSHISHIIGQLEYIIAYPILDRTYPGSLPSSWLYLHAKSASTYHSIPFYGSGFRTIPCVAVPLGRFRTRLTSWLYSSLGLALNCDNWLTANCASGCVEFVRELSNIITDL